MITSQPAPVTVQQLADMRRQLLGMLAIVERALSDKGALREQTITVRNNQGR